MENEYFSTLHLIFISKKLHNSISIFNLLAKIYYFFCGKFKAELPFINERLLHKLTNLFRILTTFPGISLLHF